MVVLDIVGFYKIEYQLLRFIDRLKTIPNFMGLTTQTCGFDKISF